MCGQQLWIPKIKYAGLSTDQSWGWFGLCCAKAYFSFKKQIQISNDKDRVALSPIFPMVPIMLSCYHSHGLFELHTLRT